MLQKLVYICVFIALYCSARIQSAERTSTLELYNVTCSKYTERIKMIECGFLKFAVSHYGISVRMMFDRDLDKTFKVRIWSDVMPKNAQKAIRIVDVKLNGCLVLKQLTKNPMLKKIMTEFRRVTNVPNSCPLKGNILYRQDNFSATPDYFPPFGPMFNFSISFELFEKNKPFVGWHIIGAKI